jgi:hypothetical protein
MGLGRSQLGIVPFGTNQLDRANPAMAPGIGEAISTW